MFDAGSERVKGEIGRIAQPSGLFLSKNLFVPIELIMSNNVESHIPIQSNPVITTPVYATPRL
jgi:hypothetical protein